MQAAARVWTGVAIGMACWAASLWLAGSPDATASLQRARPASATPERIVAKRSDEALFRAWCASCHGPNGEGRAPVFPPLLGSTRAAQPAQLVRITLHGLDGPLRVHGSDYHGVMPPLADRLHDDDIAAIAGYVGRTFAAHHEPVTSADVARIRRAERDRATAWTAAELDRLVEPVTEH